ncbi:SEFIR domain-containing protein [Actinophytocola glycyrrhizae]|uniref:SEFIR domain-containing protein n=1 Tax=Actinophytocola glycyrrhizae TaxID=2044873 RepID=A0ABV9SEQ7_9PSEU
MAVDVPRVFVTYAHESDEHKEQVLAFATFLRQVGIDAVLDLWFTDARQDWYSWILRGPNKVV